MSAIALTETAIMSMLDSGEDFPIDFEQAWKWIGYSTKGNAKRKLLQDFVEGVDYLLINIDKQHQTGTKHAEQVTLTTDCFKMLAMMAGTEQGRSTREYFLRCERLAKKAAEVIPVQQRKILELELKVAEAKAKAAAEQRLLVEKREAIAQFAPEPFKAAILGTGEIVRTEYRDRTIDSSTQQAYENFGITALCRRYDVMKGKSADTKKMWVLLESIGMGRNSDAWTEALAATTMNTFDVERRLNWMNGCL
ncbi:hypothetical protein [Synechococcus sp. PCC 7336]|uniref:hypothetical protein n=1 Tax=Synechococcus sp. PCC 7336 TaxID=195250 RepID=UPI00034528C7|nr:hypothetical protein [Synechococcus sp. PCC 7336]